jgi:hypothetical protein
MNRIITFFVVLSIMVFTGSVSYAQINEGFETGLPSTAPTTETAVSLSSGTWTLLKGAQTTDKYAGTYALSISGGGYITTPAYSGVTSFSFYAKVSGASTIKVQKSVNDGAFTDVGTQSLSAGSFILCNFAPNDSSDNVRIRITNATGQAHKIDNITIISPGSMPSIKVSTAALNSF